MLISEGELAELEREINASSFGNSLLSIEDARMLIATIRELQQSVSIPSEPLVSRDDVIAALRSFWPPVEHDPATRLVGRTLQDVEHYVQSLPAVSIPVPADAAAHSCLTYAAMVESQNDVSRPVENWSDFHRGEIYAAQQLAATFASASSAPPPSEEA